MADRLPAQGHAVAVMNAQEPTAEIIQLTHVEIIEITELSPYDGKFVGKRINRDNSVTQYPSVTYWRQHVMRIPATVVALFDYLREARTRSVCLIRGAPANLSREKTRRQNAGVKERGDHGFLDEPTRLLFFDLDGVAIDWRADPEGAVKRIVAQLGEPFASASFVWFFSASHGLETETVGDGDKKHNAGPAGSSTGRCACAWRSSPTAIELSGGGGAHLDHRSRERHTGFLCQGGITRSRTALLQRRRRLVLDGREHGGRLLAIG
jgi:hypothetical protein